LNLEMCNKMKNVDFFKYDIMMCRVWFLCSRFFYFYLIFFPRLGFRERP
jgi:hypothetical protein